LSTSALTTLQYVPGRSAPRAWLPLTFAGSAAFARDTFTRLIVVALVFAASVAVVSVWLLHLGWWPVLQQAIARLPGSGEINDGQLRWPLATPLSLADNNFLAIQVNPTGQARFSQNADLQLEFGPRSVELGSLLGYVSAPYPRGWIIGLNRTELEPLWGAWQPYLLAAAGLTVALGLVTLWLLVGLLLALPTWAYVSFLGRMATFTGCWRLATAVFLPGALILTMIMFLYGHQRLTVPELLLAAAFYPVTTLVYWLAAPRRLPASGRAKAQERLVQTDFLHTLHR
jgi:hypothetical protein